MPQPGEEVKGVDHAFRPYSGDCRACIAMFGAGCLDCGRKRFDHGEPTRPPADQGTGA